MPILAADQDLVTVTLALVLVTGGLALGTLVLAGASVVGVVLQRRELRAVEQQVESNREQIQVTREQLRPRLELTDATWPGPGQLPTANVTYASGSEAAYEVIAWYKTGDGRKFGKVANIPSLSRTSHAITIDELPDNLRERWDIYLKTVDEEVALTGDEWWAAVTWRAADQSRFCWMYVQRADHAEQREFPLLADTSPPPSKPRWRGLM